MFYHTQVGLCLRPSKAFEEGNHVTHMHAVYQNRIIEGGPKSYATYDPRHVITSFKCFIEPKVIPSRIFMGHKLQATNYDQCYRFQKA